MEEMDEPRAWLVLEAVVAEPAQQERLQRALTIPMEVQGFLLPSQDQALRVAVAVVVALINAATPDRAALADPAVGVVLGQVAALELLVLRIQEAVAAVVA